MSNIPEYFYKVLWLPDDNCFGLEKLEVLNKKVVSRDIIYKNLKQYVAAKLAELAFKEI